MPWGARAPRTATCPSTGSSTPSDVRGRTPSTRVTGSWPRTPTLPGPSSAPAPPGSGRRPRPSRSWGTRSAAGAAATRPGVAPVPGTDRPLSGREKWSSSATPFGWPVAIKAAFGGGGRGMRVVASAGEAADALESAQREAENSLWAGRVLPGEVPALAPPRRGADLRRRPRQCRPPGHPGLLGPAPPPKARRGSARPRPARARCMSAMGDAAVRVARACGYVNAGTVELIYQDGEFFFLEMNTRLQVEHPVTEMVTGSTWWASSCLVAARRSSCPFPRTTSALQGHAIEARVNAEDPAGRQFHPYPGAVTRFDRRAARGCGPTPVTRRATPSASTTTTWWPRWWPGGRTGRAPGAGSCGPCPKPRSRAWPPPSPPTWPCWRTPISFRSATRRRG